MTETGRVTPNYQIPQHIDPAEWQDWQWQLRNSAKNIKDLEKWLSLSPEEKGAIEKVLTKYRMRITPYILNLIDEDDKNCPIRKQFLPHIEEITDTRGWDDPKKEENSLPVECLFKLYPDRLVLYLTNSCGSFCRHCLRKRRFSQHDEHTSTGEIDKALAYISRDKDIRDVLVTGGDALLAPDRLIEYVLSGLRRIPHVEIIRIGSRTLSTLPQRITEDLADMLKKYHPIWVNTQFNHPGEITPESERACDILLSRGIPLGNQSVLLKGINDDADIMKKLVHKLVKIRVRPYYIYHCHYVKGGMHFQTEISKGKEIIRKLQGYTTGFAVPRYIISTPIGKIPLHNDYVVFENDEYMELQNYSGEIVKVRKNF